MIILGSGIILWILVTFHFSLHGLCQKFNLVCNRTNFKLVDLVLSPLSVSSEEC